MASLTYEEVIQAIEIPLSSVEESALEYVAGYLYKKLENNHKGPCNTCFENASKIDKTRAAQEQNTFLLYKLYDSHASLFKCSEQFESYVRLIIKIGIFVYKNKFTDIGIIEMVSNAIVNFVTCNPPILCKQQESRFVKIAARTIILNKVKWDNKKLQAKKQEEKHSKSAQKLKNLKNA